MMGGLIRVEPEEEVIVLDRVTERNPGDVGRRNTLNEVSDS